MSKRNIITSIDVETTGDEVGFHEIISITCIKFNIKDWRVLSEFNVRIKPIHFNRIEQSTLDINGYRISELREFERIAVAKKRFYDWVTNIYQDEYIIPLSHDWSFDRGFLEYWLGNVTFKEWFELSPYCTKSLANAMMQIGRLPESDNHLSDLTDYFDIPQSANAHSDAKCTMLVFKKLIELLNK